MNNNYQKEFVVLYILYPNLTNPTEVLYLKKNPKQKAPKIIWDKLVGFGGEIEVEDRINEDYIRNATKREIKEELGIRIDKKIPMIYCGKIYRKSQNRIIHFLKIAFDKKLPQKYIENEGECKYYDINYHLKNPNQFPPKDPQILSKIFFTDLTFNENL